MNDIDKIIEIFQSGDYILAFELAKSIGLEEFEFLIYVWDKCKIFEDDYSGDWLDSGMTITTNYCNFGHLRLYLDRLKDGKLEYCIINESDDTFYYNTLERALEVISIMLIDG